MPCTHVLPVNFKQARYTFYSFADFKVQFLHLYLITVLYSNSVYVRVGNTILKRFQ